MTDEAILIARAGSRLAEALRIQPLSPAAYAALTEPAHVHRFALPIRSDDGRVRLFRAWRVRYSDRFGPTKGGVRFDAATNEQDLTALALRLLIKCAVNDLPHGGAGGGVAVDPRQLSPFDRERLARAYVDAIADTIGPDRDILSPDLGTDAVTMGWMAEQYTRMHRTAVAGAINGKPVALGGIPGRPGATARGAWCVIREVLERERLDPADLTCAVQGFGSAGGRLAVLLREQGLRIVAAADASGGWHDPRGLDAAALWSEKQAGRRLAELDVRGAARVSARDVLTVAADIVVPAAAANEITAEIASRLACRMLIEIANGPVTADAEPIVEARGILVVPDVVVNAGGITMSHLEWVQNRTGLLWTEDDARERLEARMTATAHAVLDVAADRRVSLAVAAQLMAIRKIAAVLGS